MGRDAGKQTVADGPGATIGAYPDQSYPGKPTNLRCHRRPLLDPGDAKTRRLGSKNGSGRWSQWDEIGWVHYPEIGWSHSDEIRGVQSLEILHVLDSVRELRRIFGTQKGAQVSLRSDNAGVNMKIEPRFYRAKVQSGQDFAGLICVTYHLDAGKQFSGVEFYELVFPANSRFAIPSARAASFQEELRAVHQAAATFGGDRSNERDFIAIKLKEAYGQNAVVHIEEIQANA